MADNLDPDVINLLNQQLRDLTEAITSQSASMKQGAQVAGTFTSALKSSSQKVTTGSEVLKKAGSDFNSQMKQYGQTYDRTTKEWVSAKDKEMRLLNASQKAVYEELQAKRANILKEVQRNKMFSDELKSLGYSQDANSKLVKTSVELTDAQKKQIKELSKHEAKVKEMQKRYDEFGETMKKNMGDLVKGLGSFAGGLMKGESSFSMLNPVIDLVANALGSVAKLIPMFGDGIAAGIKVGADAAKFTLELLDKNLKMFQDISNMGGLVSNGMQGLQDQVIASGMSMEGFSKIVKENGVALAAYGGTVGLGAGKFTKAVGELTRKGGALEQAGLDLRKLGLTADGVGEQAAAFLQQEIRLGRSRTMTDEKLQQGTVAYIKELDLLQKITGLSREEIQKQRDALMSDTKYRMAYAKMEKEYGKEAAEGMNKYIISLKDPTLKRAFMDLASGAPTSAESAAALTMLGDEAYNVINAFKKVMKSPEDTMKAVSEANKAMQRGSKRAVDQFGDAMMYGAEMGLNGAVLADHANGVYVNSVEDAIKTQKDQLKSTDKLTEDTVKAQKAMDTMRSDMFRFGNTLMKAGVPAVGKFASALGEVTKFISKTLGVDLKGEAAAPTGPSKATVEREKAQQNLEKQTEARKQIEAEKGRGSEEAKQARIAEMRAREEARKKALEEAAGRGPTTRGTGARAPTVTPTTAAPTEPAQAAPKPAPVAPSAPSAAQKPAPAPVAPSAPSAAQKPAPAPVTPAKPATSGAPTSAEGVANYKGRGQAPATTQPGQTTDYEIPKDVASLIKFQGDNLGNKEHYDALDPAVRQNFEKMIAEYGKPVQINAAMRDFEEQQKLYDAWIARGKTGNPVAQPGNSRHNYGRALDLNSPQVNEMDMMGLLAKYGFSRVQGDPPHIEMARFGGMFDGPESGYPVMLHGREAVVPQQQLDSIKSVLEKVTKENLPSSITSPMSYTQDESISILKELYNVMSEKLDNIADKLADGNDTREELLQYSKA